MVYMKNISDYIVVFENIVPSELIDVVIEEYGSSNHWTNTTVSGGMRRDIRKCDAINMSDHQIIDQNKQTRTEIDAQLFRCAEQALTKYNDKFSCSKISGDSGYTLLRYQEGEFYSEHTDHFLENPRSVSCSFMMNDDFEGGEFAFFNREIVLRPPKGSALMFPSNFMFPHEVMPVTRRVRYSIITWFM